MLNSAFVICRVSKHVLEDEQTIATDNFVSVNVFTSLDTDGQEMLLLGDEVLEGFVI